jgi:hypothetical protein
MYLQCGPWTNCITLKLMSGNSMNQVAVSIPVKVETDSIKVKLDTEHMNYIIDDEGKRQPAVIAQSMCDMRVHIALGPEADQTLLNELIENAELKTGEISKITRGRHTTRHSELFLIAPNTYVADTPGFSSLEIDFAVSNLDEMFPEFGDTVCQFKGCSHTKEKGCGVLQALEEGVISPSRYQSYVQIYEKIKDIKPWHKK